MQAEDIRNNIKQRKNHKNQKNPFKLILVIFIILFGLYFYSQNSNITILNEYSSIVSNKISEYIIIIKSYISNLPIAALLPFDFKEKNDVLEVGNVGYYQVIDEKHITNDEKYIYAHYDGVISFIEEDDYIVLKCDNGINITYNDIEYLNVELYDRVKQGTIIGTFNDILEIKIMKNGNILAYEELKKYQN